MLKNIKNLNGVVKLHKKQQLSINGGLLQCVDPRTNECTAIGLQCSERICQLDVPPYDC